jgi:hypothetical protein
MRFRINSRRAKVFYTINWVICKEVNMATYRIVCTNQIPATKPPQHAHIVAVGVGSDPGKYNASISLNQVIQMMNNGDKFFTQGINSGKIAWVEKYTCNYCNQTHIRSTPDKVADNNLDSLPYCSR